MITQNKSSLSRPARSRPPTAFKAYLVGGDIASMAAAAFFIRDGDLLGQNIVSMTLVAKPD